MLNKPICRYALLAILMGGAPAPDYFRLSTDALRLLDPRTPIKALCSPRDTASVWNSAFASTSQATPPLLSDLGAVPIAISTKSDSAQAYFEQGIALTYGFRFDEALKSFRAARASDPTCLMCAWGVAYALGPFVNNVIGSPRAVAEARAIIAETTTLTATPRERLLADALAIRYAPGGAEGNVHATRFADAMVAIARQFPNDDFVVVLAAEAIMNTQAWDYWEGGGRKPKGRAAQAIELIETVLTRNPSHPQAAHLHVHLLEASAFPEKAEAAADRLRTLAPAAGHLVHMPSHIYYRVGRHADSIATNLAAIAADEAYARETGANPRFAGYFRHHTHFVMSSASQTANREIALRMADQLAPALPVEFSLRDGFSQMRIGSIAQTRALFLDPEAFLALPIPDERLLFAAAFHRLLRAEAYGRLGLATELAAELDAARRLRDTPGFDQLNLLGWRMPLLLTIGEQMARGRLAYARGDFSEAVVRYRTAVAAEAGVRYLEPPLLPQPASLALGSALLASGDADAARRYFQRALAERPQSSWALFGLAKASDSLGDRTAQLAAQKALAEGSPDWQSLTLDRL